MPARSALPDRQRQRGRQWRCGAEWRHLRSAVRTSPVYFERDGAGRSLVDGEHRESHFEAAAAPQPRWATPA
jgi:hypothetical protein